MLIQEKGLKKVLHTGQLSDKEENFKTAMMDKFGIKSGDLLGAGPGRLHRWHTLGGQRGHLEI